MNNATKRAVRLTLLLGLALLVFAYAGRARAFEAVAGDNVVIAADQVVTDDLYVSADIFTLDGTVEGDLLVAARLIRINGRVEGDVLAAAQVIEVNGEVADDARLFAAVLVLGSEAVVNDDVVGASNSLEARAGSMIGGDVVYGGAQALLAGTVAEDVMVGTAGFELRGEVQGNVNAEVAAPGDMPQFAPFVFMPDTPPVPRVSGGLTIDSAARVEGDLFYRGPTETAVPAGAVAGQVTFEAEARAQAEPEPGFSLVGWLSDLVRRTVVLLLIGLALVWAAPRLSRRTAAALRERPWPSVGWGLAAVFGGPIAVLGVGAAATILALVLNLVTLDGLSGVVLAVGLWLAGTLVLGLLVAAAYLAHVVVGYRLGRWLLARLNSPLTESGWLPVTIGVLVVALLTAIPIVGWVFTAVVVVLGLGALVMALIRGREYGQPGAGVAAPAT